MASAKKTGNILWAVQPFGKLSKGTVSSAKAAQVIAKKTGQNIEPVYVLSPDGFNWAGDFSNGWVKEFKPHVTEAIKNVVNKLNLNSIPAKIIVNKQMSLSGDTKKVLNYAKRSGSEIVVMSTQARTGLNRLILGSFAETALLNTKVPLLMINPHSEDLGSLKKIIFSTDLTKASKVGFRKLVKFAKKWGSDIVLYHKLPDPIEPVVQTGVHLAGGGWVSVQQFLSKEGKSRKADCQKMAAIAKKEGVKVQVVVDDTPGFVADSVIDQVKKSKADMVAMVSKTGPVASVLIGSIGRQMVRTSPVPVLLFHWDSK